MERKITDELLDSLLSQNKAKASDNFWGEFDARVKREKLSEHAADTLLAKSKVRATSSFTEEVLKGVRRLKLLRGFRMFAPAFAVAASAALVFGVFIAPEKTSDETRIYKELFALDSQMSSFEAFASFSESFQPTKQSAIRAIYDDDIM